MGSLLTKKNRGHLIKLLPYLRQQWKPSLVAGILILITVGMQLPLPLLTRYVIDHVFIEKNYAALNLIMVALFLVGVVNLSAGFGNRYILAVVREKVIRRIYIRLFEHVERLSLAFHDSSTSGYLLSRISNDVSKIQGLLADTLISFVLDAVTFVVGVVIILAFHWKLAMASLIVMPLFVYSIKYFSCRVRNKSEELQERIGKTYGILSESLSGIRLIKALCMEKTQAGKLIRRLNKQIRTSIQFTVLSSFSATITAFIGSLGPLAVLWYGGREVMNGNLSLGTLIAFNAFLGYIYGPVQRLMNLNTQVQTSLAALGRVFELFDHIPESEATTGLKRLSRIRGDIEFKKVSFSYNGSFPVLKDINLKVNSGETVAVVGKSGAGKTTLVNILMRFYKPKDGYIIIDDENIQNIDLRDLRKSIGIVSQDVFLFSGTVRDNIRCGRTGISEDDVIKAAISANAHEFILQLPNRYDTEIGERGVCLSGGQRQRLSIARTVIRDPKILILDEATSEVDMESEKLIRDALSKLLLKRTAIIIAHRLSTVHNADKIAVLDDGRIIDLGRHNEIYARCELYKRLYDMQFRE